MLQNILKPKTPKEILKNFSEQHKINYDTLKNFLLKFKISNLFSLSNVQGRVIFFLVFLTIGIFLGFIGEIFTKLNFNLTGALSFISGCVIIFSGGCVAIFGDGDNDNW